MFWPQHMTNIGWEGWLLGGFMMLLFWGGLIALVFVSMRAITVAGTKKSGSPETALEILKRRYARGEIDKAEYEAVRRDL